MKKANIFKMKKLSCQQLTSTIFTAFICLLAEDIKQLKKPQTNKQRNKKILQKEKNTNI